MKKSYTHLHLVLDSKQTDRLIKLLKKTGKVSLTATLSKSKKRKKRKEVRDDFDESRAGVGDGD